MSNPARFCTVLLVLVATAHAGCASTPPAAPKAPSVAAEAEPDRAKLSLHLERHVTYPIGQVDLLARCAKGKEFSEDEKAWFKARLAEGTYDSAEAVLKAVYGTK